MILTNVGRHQQIGSAGFDGYQTVKLSAIPKISPCLFQQTILRATIPAICVPSRWHFRLQS